MSDGQAAYHKDQLELQRDLAGLYLKVAPHLSEDEARLLAWSMSIPYMYKEQGNAKSK